MSELDRILCPHPMYAKLADFCRRAGYWLELRRVGAGHELQVVGRAQGIPRIATPFDARHPDQAAMVLLGELKA